METTTLFNYEFENDVSMTLKTTTGDELYETVLLHMDEYSKARDKTLQTRSYDMICIHLAELVRRNMLTCQVMKSKLTIVFTRRYDPEPFGSALNDVKSRIEKELAFIKIIKKDVMTRLHAPMLSGEINDLMDAILDRNGNKPSQFKEYLTPEHYRLVRMGCDVSEWTVAEQEKLLVSLKKMFVKV
jgi:hypothetical protein